jgi:hypothetical protein
MAELTLAEPRPAAQRESRRIRYEGYHGFPLDTAVHRLGRIGLRSEDGSRTISGARCGIVKIKCELQEWLGASALTAAGLHVISLLSFY